MTLQQLYIFPGTALKLTLPGCTDADGNLLDNTTAIGNWVANALDGAGAATPQSPGTVLYDGAGGNFHAIIYGQNFAATLLPVRVQAAITLSDGTTVRSRQEWSVMPATPMPGTHEAGEGYRVKLPNITWQGVAQSAAQLSPITIQVLDNAGFGSSLLSDTFVYEGVAGAFHYDIAQSILARHKNVLVIAQVSDLGGNQLYGYRWLLAATE